MFDVDTLILYHGSHQCLL